MEESHLQRVALACGLNPPCWTRASVAAWTVAPQADFALAEEPLEASRLGSRRAKPQPEATRWRSRSPVRCLVRSHRRHRCSSPPTLVKKGGGEEPPPLWPPPPDPASLRPDPVSPPSMSSSAPSWGEEDGGVEPASGSAANAREEGRGRGTAAIVAPAARSSELAPGFGEPDAAKLATPSASSSAPLWGEEDGGVEPASGSATENLSAPLRWGARQRSKRGSPSFTVLDDPCLIWIHPPTPLMTSPRLDLPTAIITFIEHLCCRPPLRSPQQIDPVFPRLLPMNPPQQSLSIGVTVVAKEEGKEFPTKPLVDPLLPSVVMAHPHPPTPPHLHFAIATASCEHGKGERGRKGPSLPTDVAATYLSPPANLRVREAKKAELIELYQKEASLSFITYRLNLQQGAGLLVTAHDRILRHSRNDARLARP
uniref:Uncharacterized protein n=1 Tax=Oryza glumipatula TaxID=40148 RepID=A0A0D9ZBE9_9ORYZ